MLTVDMVMVGLGRIPWASPVNGLLGAFGVQINPRSPEVLLSNALDGVERRDRNETERIPASAYLQGGKRLVLVMCTTTCRVW